MRRSALLAVLLACLAGAGEAAAAVVLIERDGPDPERVRIAPLDRVRWEDLTATAQRVESVGRPGFDAVSVPAGGAGERRFNRTGRYRYRLSATGQEGVVIVGAAARRPRPRGRGCRRRDVFPYDVTVRGTKAASETWNPQYELEGSFGWSYEYIARYRRVPVVVSHDCDFGTARMRAKLPGTGTLGDYVWSDQVVHRDPTGGSPVPCGFSESAQELGAAMELSGELDPSGPWSLVVESRLVRSQSDALSDLLGASRDAVCDRGDLTNSRVFDTLAGHGSVPIFEGQYRAGPLRLQPPALDLPGQFGWSGRRRPPQAVRALAGGRSFTVNSGRKTYQGTSIQTTAQAGASVKITFTRRRG